MLLHNIVYESFTIQYVMCFFFLHIHSCHTQNQNLIDSHFTMLVVCMHFQQLIAVVRFYTRANHRTAFQKKIDFSMKTFPHVSLLYRAHCPWKSHESLNTVSLMSVNQSYIFLRRLMDVNCITANPLSTTGRSLQRTIRPLYLKPLMWHSSNKYNKKNFRRAHSIGISPIGN